MIDKSDFLYRISNDKTNLKLLHDINWRETVKIHYRSGKNYCLLFCTFLLALWLQGCSEIEQLPSSTVLEPSTPTHEKYEYIIGAGDTLDIFVWKNEEVSTSVVVRPDGKINTPLVDDVKVSEKTPTEVARDIEAALAEFIREPIVTVMVSGFVGPYHEQVRVIGEASEPKTLPYNEDMTLLDVIIAVGGLTEFADGNGAVLARVVEGQYREYNVRMDDLLQDGDLSANVNILPGDIIVIPESWF